MQEPLDGIGLVHDADPSTEAGVREAVAEAANHVDDDENGPGRVDGQDDVGDDVAQRRHDCDTALAEFHVDAGVCKGSDGVASEGGQEDEGDDGVAEVIVFFQLVNGSVRRLRVNLMLEFVHMESEPAESRQFNIMVCRNCLYDSGGYEKPYANGGIIHAGNDKGQKGKSEPVHVSPRPVPSLDLLLRVWWRVAGVSCLGGR